MNTKYTGVAIYTSDENKPFVSVDIDSSYYIGLLAMAMIPLIAFASIVQLAFMTGGYGDEEVRNFHV